MRKRIILNVLFALILVLNFNLVTRVLVLANDAPVAADDSTTVAKGGTVTQLDGGATSVLDNDTDADGDNLTAHLDTDVSHSTLLLIIDGNFSYIHDGSETTSDSFTYHANDGTSNSTAATVTITHRR